MKYKSPPQANGVFYILLWVESQQAAGIRPRGIQATKSFGQYCCVRATSYTKTMYSVEVMPVRTVITCILLLMNAVPQSLASSYHAAFFNPQAADDPFWLPVTNFMKAAAEDLDIRLDVYTANHDRLRMISQVREVVTGPNPPDVILFKNFKDNATEILEISQQAGVNAFLFNAGLSETDALKTGKPREKLSKWIGQMLPDDERAGYDLAMQLIDKAQILQGKRRELKITALTGNLSDSAARERNKGFSRALRESPGIQLMQMVPARWNQQQAYLKARGLLVRYPDVNILWAANDAMALGIIEACKSLDLKIPEQCYVGGIDWNAPNLTAISENEIVVSIGGHFMEGGWVLVLLYDFFNGIDFASTEGVTIRSEMGILKKENIDQYINQFSNKNWQRIDFRKFSKHLNPSLKRYDFSLTKVLEQL